MRPSLLLAVALLASTPAVAEPPVAVPPPAPAADLPAPVPVPTPTPPAAGVAPVPAEAAPASPPPRIRLAVVPLDAPSALALIGRSLADAVAQEAARAQDFEVLSPADVLAKVGLDGSDQLARCRESAACYAGHAGRLGADRIVGGFIDRSGTNYRFGLVHVELKGGTVVARATREVPIASRRIRADVVSAAGPLLRGEPDGSGLLDLTTEEPGAEVRVDDKPVGKTPLKAKVAAGKHKVEVTQRGKVRVEPFWVDVPAGGKTEQKVRLFDIPASQMKPGEVETKVDVRPTKGRKR